MSKLMALFGNILIFYTIDGMSAALVAGSLGKNLSLLSGGVLLTLVFVGVEFAIKFFKFPVNFWSLTLVGIILNSLFFLFIAIGFVPALATINAVSFWESWGILPIPAIVLTSNIANALVLALLTTGLQMLLRKAVN